MRVRGGTHAGAAGMRIRRACGYGAHADATFNMHKRACATRTSVQIRRALCVAHRRRVRNNFDDTLALLATPQCAYPKELKRYIYCVFIPCAHACSSPRVAMAVKLIVVVVY
eukprot:6183336-Pleurochrysis_carterae.AAC.2